MIQLKSCIRLLLNKVGYDVVRLGRNNDTLADLLVNIFRDHSIQCVIDVGANAGQYGRFLRNLGFDGHIVSFEPVHNVFVRLAEEAKGDPKWHCYNLALGDKPEDKKINVYSSTVFSSFLEATDYAKGIWKSLEQNQEEVVSVVTLDDMRAEIEKVTGCSRFYLKLDTQGYDQQAFRGARATMDKVAAMQTELSMIHVYDGMPDPLDILKEFTYPGFSVAGMYPINRDESLAVIEFDCVLVRRN